MKDDGFPHSEISGSQNIDFSPKLIAVCHVLHRLMMPRHPSYARIRLARNFSLSRYVAILFNSKLSVFKDQTNGASFGGGSRIRTGDILLAKQTLYQLSYTPNRDMVGLTRIELVTSSLSGTRSNQLSYKPLVSFFGRETEHFINVCVMFQLRPFKGFSLERR